MKCLITNIHLNFPRGSEMWTATIANELHRRGFDVNVYSPGLGPFFKQEMSEIKGRTKESLQGEYFDLLILQHGIKLYENLQEAAFGKILVLSHGRLNNAERPMRIHDHKDVTYAAISPEIINTYPEFKNEWNLLFQPIGPEWFDIPKCSKELKKVLWAHHNKNIPPYKEVEKICNEKGIEFERIGHESIWPDEVISKYAESQLIFGFGRWIYQALAAGRPCVLANEAAMGYVTDATYTQWLQHNMTTRNPGKKTLNFRSFFNVWNANLGKIGKACAKHNHVSAVVDNIFDILKINPAPQNKTQGELKMRGFSCDSVETALRKSMQFFGVSIKRQWIEEANKLKKEHQSGVMRPEEGIIINCLLKTMKDPERIVELGTYIGRGTNYLIDAVSKFESAVVQTVDKKSGGIFGKEIPQEAISLGLVELITGDAIKVLSGLTDLDFIVEDLTHDTKIVQDIIKLAKKKLKIGGFLISNCAMFKGNYGVGLNVQKAYELEGIVDETLFISVKGSPNGLAIWMKQKV